MRRGTTATALVAAPAFTASACGGDGEKGGGGKSPGELSGAVTWWDASSVGSEDKVVKKIAEGFEEKHPKVDVTYVNVPFGEARNKFENAAQPASGAPDVIRAGVARPPESADLGYLAPFDTVDNPAGGRGMKQPARLRAVLHPGRAGPRAPDALRRDPPASAPRPGR
ncbi:extracellular solute-binding protein [Streptomyces sp. DT24]|uniref:extracellular solute-binding protein n=1 Tax=Streptomyces sp. DT24 TaxID=3416520 RepID=UPI003CE9F46E